MYDKLHTTFSSTIFACTFDQAKELAKLADITLVTYPDNQWEDQYVQDWVKHHSANSSHTYWAWEDRRFGGGQCRITWQPDSANDPQGRGLLWISSHSGYESYETWPQVAEYAEHIMHMRPVNRDDLINKETYVKTRENPRLYNDFDRFAYQRNGD